MIRELTGSMSRLLSYTVTEMMPLRPGVQPKMVEKTVQYSGEYRSHLSFFFQFRNIIMRWHGSVIPFILPELAITIACSVIATSFCSDEDVDPSGHMVVGTLLAFLVVFRSQMAWGQYTEGRAHVGAIVSRSRALALEVLGGLSTACAAEAATVLPEEASECCRLLKMFYYLCVEHLRSTDGHGAWEYAQRIAHSFGTPREVRRLLAEYGRAQPAFERLPVVPVDAEAELMGSVAEAYRETDREGTALHRLQNRWQQSEMFSKESEAYAKGPPLAAHDATRGKPLLVLLWLRQCCGRVHARSGGRVDLQYMSNQLECLSTAYCGIDKVDTLVLPLPYCQLLKVFLLCWVFSLPFVLAAECGLWLTPTMMLIAAAFFGLDHVGAELEGPFGVDANDFPLLRMGVALVDDLDAMLRTAVGDVHSAAERRARESEAAAAMTIGDARDVDDSDHGPVIAAQRDWAYLNVTPEQAVESGRSEAKERPPGPGEVWRF